MNIVDNITNHNINNNHHGIYNIMGIQPHLIDNNNYNQENYSFQRKQNRHLRILLISIENLVFQSDNSQFNDFTLREFSLMMGLSSLRELNFPEIMIGPQSENQIRNFIENSIDNNQNIINNDNNNNADLNETWIFSDSLRILRCSLEELIFNSIYINNYLLNFTFREIIRIFGLYNLDSNNFPTWRLSYFNRPRILNFIDNRQRIYHLGESMNPDNNHDLTNLMDELLNLLFGDTRVLSNNLENGPFQNPEYEDTNEDRQLPKCSICLENNCAVVFIPCGHMCCCHTCSRTLNSCPVCRQLISSRQTTYL